MINLLIGRGPLPPRSCWACKVVELPLEDRVAIVPCRRREWTRPMRYDLGIIIQVVS